MAEIIKNSEIPHDELVFMYEQQQEDLKKKYDKNLQLKAEITRLQSHINQLNVRFRRIFNESKIALSE